MFVYITVYCVLNPTVLSRDNRYKEESSWREKNLLNLQFGSCPETMLPGRVR